LARISAVCPLVGHMYASGFLNGTWYAGMADARCWMHGPNHVKLNSIFFAARCLVCSVRVVCALHTTPRYPRYNPAPVGPAGMPSPPPFASRLGNRLNSVCHYPPLPPITAALPRITTHYHALPLPPITPITRPITAHYRSITAASPPINSVLPACRKPAGGVFWGGGRRGGGAAARRGSSAGCVKKRGEGRSLFQTALQFRTV
jgi:hypothetical protein